MKDKKGFTLIELLVVVLIIGILAAIALPQYKKAVMKARLTEALIQLKAIAQADQVCRLSKNKEFCKINELDITLPGECDEYMCWTDSFLYSVSSNDWDDYPNVNAFAVGYDPTGDDLCICYLTNGNIVLRQDGSGCHSKTGNYDFSELLNIPEDTENLCHCC